MLTFVNQGRYKHVIQGMQWLGELNTLDSATALDRNAMRWPEIIVNVIRDIGCHTVYLILFDIP
jgi:hypothetical protein